MTTSPTPPTPKQYEAFQKAFDYFNDNLFDGKLPNVILNFSRSGKRTVAFFKRDSWAKSEEEDKSKRVSEISLAPRFLKESKEFIFSSLVHEMCHLWQYALGEPSRVGYHNKQWAEKMKEVGLQPISSSGGETGQSCSEETIDDGKFKKALKAAGKDMRLPLRSFWEETFSKPSSRNKYVCPKCQMKVWGKKELLLICGFCHKDMELAEE